MRPYLELPRELWIEIFGKSWSRLTPQVVSMAGRLTAEGYKGYAHISDAAAWKAIAPEDQEEIREGMAADFEDSSMRDELLSFHRAAVELRNDPAVLSCFKSGRDVPRIPWITETSSAKDLAYMYAPMEAAAHAV